MSDLPSILCTVCKQPLDTFRQYGHRHYCAVHYDLFYRDRPALWRACGLTFSVLAIIIMGLTGLSLLHIEPVGNARLAANILIIVAPGFVWFAALYRNTDRPDSTVPALVPIGAAIGILLAIVISHPILTTILGIETWAGRTSSTNRFLASIFIGGYLHSFMMYLFMRFIAWENTGFARRVDSLLLLLAMIWGYATALNLVFTPDLGALLILNGGLRIISRLCAFLVPGMWLSYFFGHNRFEDAPFYFLAIGVAIAAVLNGLLLFVGSELNNTGLGISRSGFNPWPGVAVNLIALVFTFFILRGLIRRQNILIETRIQQSL